MYLTVNVANFYPTKWQEHILTTSSDSFCASITLQGILNLLIIVYLLNQLQSNSPVRNYEFIKLHRLAGKWVFTSKSSTCFLYTTTFSISVDGLFQITIILKGGGFKLKYQECLFPWTKFRSRGRGWFLETGSFSDPAVSVGSTWV